MQDELETAADKTEPTLADEISPGVITASKDPTCVRKGKKWVVENQSNNNSLIIEGTEMDNSVYVCDCIDSTVTVKGKINSITMDSCKKTSVVFDSVVSTVEIINCKSTQVQVFGKVPTISVSSSDGCQIFLSQESLDVEIISSKSSEMNVLAPMGNGDVIEYPIPDQFKTTINTETNKLTTVPA